MTEKKHRLSKLQKWILMEALKDEKMCNADVYRTYFGFEKAHNYRRAWIPDNEMIPKNLTVILSRSKNSLIEQGYLKNRSWDRQQIELTEEGTKKAQELKLAKIGGETNI